ncbi:MAG TPA: hypothetical protein VMB21_13415 [Candidatus Limnocylindria bacterium]|nr:hypothetical protein [Candidatus Limnocylindria bacterium]
MKSIRWSALYAGVVALLATGCTSFEKKWQTARQQPLPAGDLTGAWTGSWQNTNNSHGGALRALITRVDGTDYTARFHAVWGSHSGSFKTRLTGRQEGDDFVFEGRKRILGFLITTRGHANATNFFSTYESRFDTGTFTLKRPAAGE